MNQQPEISPFARGVTRLRQEDWHGGHQTLAVWRNGEIRFEVWEWGYNHDWQEFFEKLCNTGLTHQQIYMVIECAAKCRQREREFSKVNRH